MRIQNLIAALTVLVSAAFAATVAHADEPATQESADGPDYRYQLIIADAASWGVTLAGGAANAPALSTVGGLGMLFAAPSIHAANGNGAGFWESLGLRVGLTGAGALIGYHAASKPRNDLLGVNQLYGATLGGMAGMATAQIVDWTLIGGKSHNSHEKTPASGFTLTPAVSAGPMGGQIGAVGTF